jgi:hypothetical protein
MSTESVKVCLLPSAFTYCKRPLIRQSATATLNLHPLALHQNSKDLITRKDISTSKYTNKKIKDSFPGYFPPTSPPPFKSGPWSLKKKWHPPSTMTPNSPLLEWAPEGQNVWGRHQCLLLPIFWFLRLPSHLPWKHHALSDKTSHLLCCCQHRRNSHIHAPPFLE